MLPVTALPMRKGVRLVDIERYVEELTAQAAVVEPEVSGIERPSSLKGRAVELWRAGERFFLVADEADARAVVERGIGSRGETWTAAELELVARVEDEPARNEIQAWKHLFDGRIRGDA